MSELPPTWAESTVGQCFLDVRNGTTATQNSDGKGLPVSRIETVQNRKFDLSRIRHLESLSAEAIENFRYRPGDIAFSHINSYEHVGKTALYDGKPETFIHGMNLLRLRLGHDQIVPRFAHLFMQTRFFREEVRQRVGHAVNQVSINQKNLAEVPFVVAPLREQRRIVAKLGALLDKVDACQRRLLRIPLLLKRFRQSILAAACSGRLTEDWREKQGMAREDWASVGFFDFFVLQRGYDLPLSQASAGSYPIVTSAGIVAHHSQFKARKPGVVTGRSGSIGKVFFIESDYWPHNTALFVKDFKGNEPKFVYYFLSGFNTTQFSASSAVPTLNRNNLREVVVEVPPLPEQQEIVRRVEGLFALADQLEVRLAKARGQVDALTPSLLARAFAGQLVPQDPTDEPAEKLLEKIKAARKE
jgi:type I restriction enzyme, S subunit